MLETWPGALVAVSHDRAFLERTVTDVVVLDGRGRAGRVPGGYAAYEAERRASRSRGKATSTAGTAAPKAKPAVGGGSAGRKVDGATAPRSARSPSTLRHLMKKAEAEVRKLEQRQAALEAELAAVGADHAALARIGAEMAEVGADLAAAEDGWLALAEEAEAG
jgi:ATP-binding cassette subfamily F protein uup